jgi:P27 family predicted phage terminase small subunit
MVTGRKPKPRKIKELEGNRSKVGRASIGAEPAGIGLPTLPAHLKGDSAELWRVTVRSLPDGLLTSADDAALEMFAREWATYREADAGIQRVGYLVNSPQGPIRNPLLTIRNSAMRNASMLGAQLGLSPVARARLAQPNHADDDPMALLLGPDDDPNGAWSTAPKTRQ